MMAYNGDVLIDERLDFVPKKRIPAKVRLFARLYFEHPEGGAVRMRIPIARKEAVTAVMFANGWIETDAPGYRKAQKKVARMDSA